MSETDVSDYQKSLIALSDIVGKTLVAAVTANKGYSPVTEMQDAITQIIAELDLVSNTLGTILNWIRLQETAMAALGSLEEWASVAASENDVDAIRHRMRLAIQPQVESFVQSISSADKASRIALPFMSEDLTKIPALIKKLSDVNVHLLELIEYEPSTKTSLLDSGVNALYRGAVDDFQTRIDRLDKNTGLLSQENDE
ncbi:MAG: hypothetical protein ACE5OZ_20380 [Candidatus Heimdallarchaeota archaeon]